MQSGHHDGTNQNPRRCWARFTCATVSARPSSAYLQSTAGAIGPPRAVSTPHRFVKPLPQNLSMQQSILRVSQLGLHAPLDTYYTSHQNHVYSSIATAASSFVPARSRRVKCYYRENYTRTAIAVEGNCQLCIGTNLEAQHRHTLI